MPPNITDISVIDPESMMRSVKNETKLNVNTNNKTPVQTYKWMIFQSSVNLIVHLLTGTTVGITLCYAFRKFPLSATQVHVILCVLGYQLLMTEAILSFTSENGWSSKLRYVDKRRAHWILMLVGSVMAIAGSIIEMLHKEVNLTTIHGKLGFIAMVFTFVSLINGVTSLYAYELRGIISGNLSKLSHIIFGTLAFVIACCCLCYGFNKGSFKSWATPNAAYTLMAFTGAFALIVIVNPIFTFSHRFVNMFKIK